MPSGPLVYGGSAGAGLGGAGGTLQGGTAFADFQQLASGLFTLVNATPTIAVINVPADSLVKTILIAVRVVTTSAETGGACGVVLVDNLGTSSSIAIDAGGHAAGTAVNLVGTVLVSLPSGANPGEAVNTITVSQTSALSAGAATLYYGVAVA